MHRLISAILLTFLSFSTSAAFADGLIYQLPEDGTSLEFEMKMTLERDGQTEKFDGSLTVSSVGKETVDGQPCRWIEFRMVMKQDGQERIQCAKALVPEAELANGKSPVKHVKKAWYKPGDRDAQEITELTSPNAGPLPGFLAGPFQDAKKLDAKTIDSGLGKLECKGTKGSTEFKSGSLDHKITFTNRLHKKAPFGVVASDVQIEMTRNGDQEGRGTMTLVAKKTGKNAVSQISNGL